MADRQTTDHERSTDAEVDGGQVLDHAASSIADGDASAHVLPTVAETPSCEADLASSMRTAFELMGLGSDPSMNASKTLKRSERFRQAVEPVKRALLERVRVDAGGTEDAPETLLAVQEGFVEASLFRRSMFLRLVDSGGPITGKGRTRALYLAWCQALDREMKLAQVLGLTRKTRKIATLESHVMENYGERA